MTATNRINQALAENAAFALDHETRKFMGFRFRLSTEARDTVVRIHKDDPILATILAA